MEPVRGWLPKPSDHPYIVQYAVNLTVPSDFGQPGAIIITNLHDKEFFLMEIVVRGFSDGPTFFPANSWIHSHKDNPSSRILFSNKVRINILQNFRYGKKRRLNSMNKKAKLNE